MTSVLAPQGIGLWGQNLRFTGAVGIAPAIPSDAYNRNSIGQRGGTVITPIADVTGAGQASSSSRDPFNKQAATLIIRDEPKPRTLRDGFSGGEASFERGGIVTPIARTTLTEPEIKARLAAEGKSTRPASATPISLDDAIAMLKAAEEAWPASDDDEPKIDAGYLELVSDAKRLKIIKGATMRRPITDEEQTIVTQIASKYASALGEQSSEVVGAEAAAAAEDARPALQAASLAAAVEQVNQKLKVVENDMDQSMGVVHSEAARVDELQLYRRDLAYAFRQLDRERDDARAARQFNRANKLGAEMRKLRSQGDTLESEIDKSNSTLQILDQHINNTMLARNELDDQADELADTRVEPSRSAQMRLDSNARFAPHDRERQQQAAMMRGVMDPQFALSRKYAGEIADAVRGDMGSIARDTLNRFDNLSGNLAQGFIGVRDSVYREGASTRSAVDSSARLTNEAINEQKMAIQDEIANLNDMLVATVEKEGRKGRNVTSSTAAAISNRIGKLEEILSENRTELNESLEGLSGNVADVRTGIGRVEDTLAVAAGRSYAAEKRAERAVNAARQRAAASESAADLRAYNLATGQIASRELITDSLSEQLSGMESEAAAREGRMANQYATQEEKTRTSVLEPYTQMSSNFGLMGQDVAAMRQGLGSISSVIVSTKEKPVTLILQSAERGQRGESLKDSALEEFTQSGGGFVRATTTIHTPPVGNLRRG